MTCAECERLLDAYLDNQLAGTLRLEFDAHRVHCERCRRTLAIVAALSNVIAADSRGPELSPNFTDRVMRHIPSPARRLRPTWPIAAAAAVLPAAAAIMLAFLGNPQRVEPTTTPTAAPKVALRPGLPAEDYMSRDAVRQLIADRIEDRLWDMRAAGTKLTADFVELAGYLNITVPDAVVRESTRMAGLNPFLGLWDSLIPAGEQQEPEPATPDDGVHSI